MSSVQLLHRIRGVGQASSFDLHVETLEPRLILCREAHHREAVGFRCQGRRAMRRSTARDEKHAVEVCTFQRRFGRGDVSEVDRIEGAAEDSHPAHGWYSNSVSAMRTVSPGCTPADSNAALTPSRSSSDW